MKKLFEVVKLLDVEPFQAGDGEAFRFRLEIRRELDTNIYEGRVYRLETYRLQPTFPMSDQGDLPDWVNDAMIYVTDEAFDDNNSLSGSSTREVIEKFQSRFQDIFFNETLRIPKEISDEPAGNKRESTS
jgi:hypothetical protein